MNKQTIKTAFFTFVLLLTSFASAQATADEFFAQAMTAKKINPRTYDVKKNLKAALKLNPKHEKALYELALFHMKGDTDIYAHDLLNRVIEINPNNSEYYWMRAVVNIQPTATDEALKQADKDIDSALALGWSDANKVAKAKKYIKKFMTK